MKNTVITARRKKDRIADLAGMFHYRQLGKFVCNNLL